MSSPKNTRHLRIDEHASYSPTPTRVPRNGKHWMDRKRQEGSQLIGPAPTDETPDERERAIAEAQVERINPILAAKFIDQYIRGCK